MGEELCLWLPTMAICATPERGRRLVTDDFIFTGIKINRVTGSPGNVAEMAEQRAFLTIFDFGFQFFAGADAFYEIAEME